MTKTNCSFACHSTHSDFQVVMRVVQGCFCQVIAKSPTWGFSGRHGRIEGGCPFSKFQIEFWEHESQRQRLLLRLKHEPPDHDADASLEGLLARDRVF
jgi:hypothetical protein